MYRDLTHSVGLSSALTASLNRLEAWQELKTLLDQNHLLARLDRSGIEDLIKHLRREDAQIDEMIAELQTCNGLLVLLLDQQLVVIGDHDKYKVDDVYAQLKAWQRAGELIDRAVGKFNPKKAEAA